MSVAATNPLAAAQADSVPAAAERLPCRGCTRDCPNYSSCDGRPWSQKNSNRRCAERY